MTLLQIFEIERDVAENPPLPSLTVKRIPASNPDYIWLVLEWPQGNKIQSHEVTKSNRTKSMSSTITTTGNCGCNDKSDDLVENC